ncbi:MAG: hypothetical protein ACD_42C00502G0003 [uncultured bacterium]|nr:MAG: hypothetical protein ACD_42C00502G0003 [uncultured bacterium]OGT33098.1 MAG: hypothetical protein A3C44_05830 [Gammaproteobacteria bacterium RIFCSPHIGHO2_02_FULL_39_13]OGT49321.1 MAG: hypothetical protein A3E53_07710 [Gammaproteobacteria bacterium RIFCSPHIGHO2_12_FULL_39_24]
MMKKKLLAMGLGAVLSMSTVSAMAFDLTSSGVANGLTLTSNIGGVDVYCNAIKGPKTITNIPLNLPWFVIIGMFHSQSLQCQFYPDGVQPASNNEIGSADLQMTFSTGTISNVQTYNGHAKPVIAYSADDKSGISVTLNQ